MEPRRTVMHRVLGQGRFELVATGAMLGALPLYAIARGTEHGIAALIILGVGMTYIGMAMASAVRDA